MSAAYPLDAPVVATRKGEQASADVKQASVGRPRPIAGPERPGPGMPRGGRSQQSQGCVSRDSRERPTLTRQDYLQAARVPESLQPQEFGFWAIRRITASDPLQRAVMECRSQTLLHRMTEERMHLSAASWTIVMEDSPSELRKHLPIWFAAHGRVLVTGLGLGCVVRGLLASPRVKHIDVIEIDADIIAAIGSEFAGDARVTIHLANALTYQWPPSVRWDFAWHDLWCETHADLHHMHIKLIDAYRDRIPKQGAWAFPKQFKRIVRPWGLIG